MRKLPLHDAQINYMGFNPIRSQIEILLHRGNEIGQYFLVNIRLMGVKEIKAIDGKDFDALFEDGGGIYEASIETKGDVEVLDISGPEYWQLIITADKIYYEERLVTDMEVETQMAKSIRIGQSQPFIDFSDESKESK